MKAILLKFLVVSITLALVVISCKDDTTYELGDRLSSVVGISDEWQLKSVVQVDETNCSDDNSMDVSDFIINNSIVTASFTQDGNFTIDLDDSKVVFPESATWAFDDKEYPSQVLLTSDNETLTYFLEAPIREKLDNQLIIKYSKPLNDCFVLECRKEEVKYSVSYIYTFDRK